LLFSSDITVDSAGDSANFPLPPPMMALFPQIGPPTRASRVLFSRNLRDEAAPFLLMAAEKVLIEVLVSAAFFASRSTKGYPFRLMRPSPRGRRIFLCGIRFGRLESPKLVEDPSRTPTSQKHCDEKTPPNSL